MCINKHRATTQTTTNQVYEPMIISNPRSKWLPSLAIRNYSTLKPNFSILPKIFLQIGLSKNDIHVQNEDMDVIYLRLKFHANQHHICSADRTNF